MEIYLILGNNQFYLSFQKKGSFWGFPSWLGWGNDINVSRKGLGLGIEW